MAEDRANHDLEITGDSDEGAGWISGDQARVIALREAAENPRSYRRGFRNVLAGR